MKKAERRAWVAGILSLGTFLMILLTIHDIQTAQGVGLYLSLLGSFHSRIIFDIIVDVMGIVLLALLLFIPCFLLGWLNAESFFRLLAAYLALLPSVDLAAIVHFFDSPGIFSLRQALVEGNVLEFFFSGMKEISPILRLWLPLFCLLLMGNHILGSKGLKRWQNRILLCQIPLLLGVFLFPVISSFLSFIMQYLLLLVCFDIWERWYKTYSNMHLLETIIFGGFWLRGIYLMIEVMSVWAQ